MSTMRMTPPSAAMEFTEWSEIDATAISNTTGDMNTDSSQGHKDLGLTIQIISLWVMFGFGVLGNTSVMIWMHLNRRRKSRVNTIVLGIASADMSVCFFSILPTALILMSPTWEAGNIMCKLVMYLQGASLISSANMLAVMAIDRHQAVLQPLREFFTAWKLVVISWGIAGTLALPQLYVWEELIRNDKPRCGSLFRSLPPWHRMAYIVYIAVITFWVPFMVITFAYLRISKKIWDKAHDTSGKRSKRASKKNKIELNRNASGTTLTKAKSKTLKMSVVIIFFFVLCGAPYFVVEMLVTFRSNPINGVVSSFFGLFAVCNSATNPYIFLHFNTSQRCWKELRLTMNRFLCCCARGNNDGGYYNRYSVRFSSSNSRTEFTKIQGESSMITRVTEAPSRVIPLNRDHDNHTRLGRTE